MTRPPLELGRLAHGGIVRAIPGCPRLHVESGWITSPRGRERLVWLLYLRCAAAARKSPAFSAHALGELT